MNRPAAVSIGRARRGSRLAVECAAREAVAGLDGAPARGALVFLPWAGLPHSEVSRRVRAVVGTVPVAGGTFAAGFSRARRTEGEVVVLLFGGDDVHVGCGLSDRLCDAPAALGEACGAACDRLGGVAPALVLLFFDPLAADLRRLAAGARALSPAPLLGFATGTGLTAETRPVSVQLAGDAAVGGGVAALALGGPGLRAATAAFHGELARGRALPVTAVSGRRLAGLDGAPALSAWEAGPAAGRRVLLVVPGAPAAADGARTAAAAAAGAPFAVVLPVWGTDPSDGALVTAAALHQGERVAVVATSAQRAVEEATGALPRLLAPLGGRPLLALCSAAADPDGPPALVRALAGVPLVGVRAGAALVGDGPYDVDRPYPLSPALALALLVEAA